MDINSVLWSVNSLVFPSCKVSCSNREIIEPINMTSLESLLDQGSESEMSPPVTPDLSFSSPKESSHHCPGSVFETKGCLPLLFLLFYKEVLRVRILQFILLYTPS